MGSEGARNDHGHNYRPTNARSWVSHYGSLLLRP